MTRPLLALTLAAAFGLTSCGAPRELDVIPTVPQTQSLPPPADLRDFRYGEVITVFRDWLRLRVSVYNTMGLNDCPPERFAKLDAAAIARKIGATRVALNGPRHWVLNGIEAGGETATGRVVQFGDLQLRWVAQLESRLWQGSVGQKFYEENQVRRTTTFIYHKGNMVYELKSPTGAVYRMQSYAQILEKDLQIADLDVLGPRLKLPPGWTYKARVLDKDSNLHADGLAYVINDDLYNTYQRVTP